MSIVVITTGPIGAVRTVPLSDWAEPQRLHTKKAQVVADLSLYVAKVVT